MGTKVDEVIAAWAAPLERKLAEDPESVRRAFYLTQHLLRLLAEGQPVAAEALAARADVPLEIVVDAFQQIKKKGGEFDEAGCVVGNVLTLKPTPHRFAANGRTLYAWCALDTIFLPGLLEEMAEVKSTCPVTGKTIRLTITPSGVTHYDPAGTVLSIAVPGVSCNRKEPASEADRAIGARESCHQMYFFSSRAAAEKWVKNFPGVVIFTIEEAWQLARVHWIDRRQQEVLVSSEEGRLVSADGDQCQSCHC
jgi:alkylmercury lyase